MQTQLRWALNFSAFFIPSGIVFLDHNKILTNSIFRSNIYAEGENKPAAREVFRILSAGYCTAKSDNKKGFVTFYLGYEAFCVILKAVIVPVA